MDDRLFAHIAIENLKGISTILVKKYHHLGIFTVRDLLLHVPLRYENRALTQPISELTVGEHTTIKGQIIQSQVLQRKTKMLVCHVKDETGVIQLKFMHFNPGMKASLTEGKWIKAYGEIKANTHLLEIVHPQFQVKSNQAALEQTESEQFTPIYPTTFGLTQNHIRKLIDQALLLVKRNPPQEIFSPALIAKIAYQMMPIEQALQMIHYPTLDADIATLQNKTHPAYQRFIIEELLAYHASMLSLKTANQHHIAQAITPTKHLITPFLSSLPFSLTNAQQRVIQDIWQDMQKSVPMMRLIQGDVGSGKTLVAAMAALNALENQQQVVLLAPTEILAEQHCDNLKQWFTPLGITVESLSGRLSAKIKKQRQDDLVNNRIHLLVGTHAVFYDKVQFHHLGLVIIDEQHRFGVNQRLTIWQKGAKAQQYPHQLIMTATPIPRTLAMTIYAYLDISIIDELPPGRTPITTVVISNARRNEIIERVYNACQAGRQVYWVCTLVEESEVLDAQAAEILVEELRQQLPDLHIGLVHGKMKSKDKQAMMQSFKQGEIQLLVATTVIEVGVDVPNASLMIIENAERLGLSQLHQLRGRVGRGSAASHCVLMYQAPLSKTAQARLKVMRDSHDGFVIAQKDLDIRGGGEILGTKQIGVADFKVVDLARDQSLLSQTLQLSHYIQNHYPNIANTLVHYWLPDREKYIHA